MIETTKDSASFRIVQGDIFENVEFIEYAVEKEGIIEVSKILFPLVMVLTQDCDLLQDSKSRAEADTSEKDQDKWLLSVLVAPIYNAEHVYIGDHLSDLNIKMAPVSRNKTPGDYLRQNQRPRYHFLEFSEDTSLVSSVIDFKHYFSVNVRYLSELKKTNYVCTVSNLYREAVSQRFAYFLSRIGLPGGA